MLARLLLLFLYVVFTRCYGTLALYANNGHSWTLSLTQPGVEHILAQLKYDNTSLSLDNTIAYSTGDDSNNNNWCVSLINAIDPQYSFNCFTFLKGKISELNTGNLNIDLFNNEIIDVNYYVQKSLSNTDNNSITLNIVQNSVIMPNPQPRLKLMQGQTPQLDVVSSESKRKTPKKKKVDLKKEINEDFIEIIKPKGLYGDKKTFIEKYWLYIIPPMAIIFIIKQFF